MKFYGRSVVAMVLLFTAAAVAMLWGLNQRSRAELSEQVIARAQQRSMQLADAMAGQVAAELALMDHTLLGAREAWLTDPAAVPALTARRLKSLPDALVTYVSLVNADGVVTFNSAGVGIGLDVSDRSHFTELKTGADRMLIGAPVKALIDGAWLIPVGRPLYRGGQFAGAMYLLVSSERLAQKLGRLALADDDIVALLKHDGQFLARSLNNESAMGQTLPKSRPFLLEGAADVGSFRETALVDRLPRVYGWHHLAKTGTVLVVGLAESSVLAPLAPAMKRSMWIAGALSSLLLTGGLAVAWLLWRDGRSAQAMRENEWHLKAAQRMAKVAHMTYDFRTGVTVWSDEMYRIFGYRRDDPGVMVQGPEAVYSRVHPDDLPGVKGETEKAIRNCGSLELVHRIVLPDGRIKHLQMRSVFEGVNGVAVNGRSTVQDITEVREAQLALEEANENLEARVEDRTRELASLNQELEAFTYSVSHDLRTPLRSIHGFASLLEEDAEALSPEARTHLRRIQDGARRMGLLITDLLTMAHQSRAVVNAQRLNLSELAQAVANDIERQDTQRKVVWHVEPLLWAWADPVLMRVVLQNLLGNAWKYTSQTEQAEISVQRVGSVGRMTEFCVRDNGAGFDMAYVDQLFQPFKRLHAHHEFEGTGVGLASVQRLVQRHGGTVRADGAVGQGAAFYFTLPTEPAGQQPAPQSGGEQPSA